PHAFRAVDATFTALMTELKRSLRTIDGLAMVVGIMVGSGIFRTPGLVAAYLGRPSLTFVAWILGGVVALLGALCFAELSTRHPAVGGECVCVREACGPRAGFVVGWGEALATYPVAIAAIAVVAGEYAVRLVGLAPGDARWAGVGLAALFTAVNLAGVASGRWVQNLATGAKVLVLAGVAALAFAAGDGVGWRSTLPAAPTGIATLAALALAFQAVVWTYYGYLDVAKIAEAVAAPARGPGAREPGRHAVGGDTARGRGRRAARRDRHVPIAPGSRRHGHHRHRRLHRAVSLPAARSPAERAVSGAALPARPALVRGRV